MTPAHTLKKYMNPGTHSEEVHDPPAHTLKNYMNTVFMYFFRVCAG
jgi:hypothetical protein